MDKSASQMYIAHFCNPKTKLKAQEWTILCFIWKKEQNCIWCTQVLLKWCDRTIMLDK